MSVEIKQTIRFSFAASSSKPSMEEIANFVKALDADPTQMIATYRMADETSMFIKFKSEDSMLYCLLHNREQLIFRYADGTSAEIRMTPAGTGVQYVKVYGLPPEVSDSDISLEMAKYGDVKRIVREKYPMDLGLNMYTGVRGVYMEVKKEIPNSLLFRRLKGNIFYQGNKHLCFLCQMEGHHMNSCPKRKNRKQPEQQKQEEGNQQRNGEQSGTSTYAGVVNGDASSTDNNEKNTEDAVEVLEEEEVEMNEASSDAVEKKGEEASVAKNQQLPVFKCNNDRYYYYKFGIVDYTEKERLKDEEESKRLAVLKEKQLEEARKLSTRPKAEAKLRSPPRKAKKKE